MPRRLDVFVEVPAAPADKWRWTPLSEPKVKREEPDDDVILLAEVPASKKRRTDRSTNDDVQIKIEETAEELKVKLERKVKIEPMVPVLDPDDIRRRLDGLPHHPLQTTLTEEEQMHTVTRQLITEHYKGGHNVYTDFIAYVESLGGRAPFLCPNRSMNPFSPRIPGVNGLFLNSGISYGADADDSESKSSIVEEVTQVDITTLAESVPPQNEDGEGVEPHQDTKVLEDKKPQEEEKDHNPKDIRVVLAHIAPGHWRYVGHYALTNVDPLSTDEWDKQSRAFKNSWVNDTMTRHDAYELRQLVWHRKQLRAQLQREPTKDEVRRELRLLSRKDLPGLKPEDVELAFHTGELCVGVTAMCFMKYVEEFQRELIDISANPRPRRRKTKPKPKKPKREPSTIKSPKIVRRAASDDSYIDD